MMMPFRTTKASILFLLALPISDSASGANLAPGFTEEIFVAGTTAATTFDWAPDGTLWIGGKLGHVWVWRSGARVEVAVIPVDVSGEHGLLGIAIDPEYAVNGHVWIYYTTAGPPYRNRLSRFRSVGDQLVEEKIVLETPDLTSIVHTGGCIRFASDRTLYLTTGDDLQRSQTSQNPFDLRGKVLHIDRDGSPAEDNPFIDGQTADPRVWALGLRNPWRCSIQPESGNLFIGDVGGSRYEELNVGVPGGNFGWPEAEGPNPPGIAEYIYPIYSYPHTSPLGHAIIAGGHATALSFPSEFEGDYFIADQVTREIFRIRLDESNQLISAEVFASDLGGGPVEMKFGPDGALYYAAHNESRLFRISYAGGANRQPVANASVSQDSGPAPLRVTFDASGSFDPDDDPLSFRWDFGDGTSSSQAVVDKDYGPGVYSASLLVTDAKGGTSRVDRIRIVSGNERPEAVIQEPKPDRHYYEGEVIVFSGIGIDPEEGATPCESMNWSVIFHHLGHTHPFLGPLEGVCGSRFVVTSHGEESTFFEIRLTVKDEGRPLSPDAALTGVQSLEIYPK
jgi:glucose/arabinose dehydrogenase